jgi:DNA-directed RNA polymerase alpha subunit
VGDIADSRAKYYENIESKMNLGRAMSKIVIEVESSDTAEILKIIKRLQNQVKANRDEFSEQLHEDRLKELAPGTEPFLPDAKIRSVLYTGIHSRYNMEIAGLETLGDLIKMSRKDLIQIKSVGHMVVNEIDNFLWTAYGMRLPKNSNQIL